MPNYFLIGATKDHVTTGVKKGFAQAGHGRKDLMAKPLRGDWIIYYSAKDKFDGGKPYQKFTALGKIIDDEPYKPSTKDNFKPYRRKVEYQSTHDVDIRPLLTSLEFIKNKKRWGFYLMSGFREISKEDFETIKGAMKS
jgi:predicted RNA-binding protein